MFENVDGKEFRDVTTQVGEDFLRRDSSADQPSRDLNNDGAMDLVVTSLNEKPRILINSGDTGNHWLMIEATGHKSSRDAIGAKMKLTTASGRTLYNHVSISVGFMSSSDRRVHFGLGAEKTPVTLELRWPSGATQTLKDVAADQFLKVEEPQ